MNKDRITITIPHQLLEQLDKYRFKSGYTRSYIIWQALRLFLSSNKENIT